MIGIVTKRLKVGEFESLLGLASAHVCEENPPVVLEHVFVIGTTRVPVKFAQRESAYVK